MFDLNGKFGKATVFTDNIEDMAIGQILELCNQEFTKDCKISIMPDVHAGKGCTIGTTMEIKNKIVPNLVGVDIGCFVGDTKIPLLDGTQKTIKELTLEKDKFYVYSVNKNGEIVPGKAIAFKTKSNASLVKVTISGGSEIICTPDHKFMMRDGSFVEAKDLRYLDSLMPLYRTYQTRDGYESIIQPNNKKLPKNTHKLVALLYHGEIKDGYVVHHINDNKFDNRPENLMILSAKEHNRIHASSKRFISRIQSDEFKEARIKTLKEKGFYNEKFRDKKKEVDIRNITKYMNENKESFAAVVKNNAERGSKFFANKNSDAEMILKQKIGRIKKILTVMNNDNVEITEESYEKYRLKFYNYPKFDKAIETLKEYGLSIEDIKNGDYSKAFNNHKVIKVEEVEYTEDVYCLNVEEHHNFALSAGVFVHNCGMLTTMISEKEVDFEKLDKTIKKYVPCGQGIRSKEHRLTKDLGLNNLRCINNINLDRALKSLGTLGGGNHFIELNKDEEGNLYLVIHSGSRYLGKQVAEYYQKRAIEYHKNKRSEKAILVEKLKAEGRHSEIESELNKFKRFNIPEALCYLEGADMEDYLHDMKIVQNYANTNRKAMAEEIISNMGLTVSDSFTTIHNYIDLDKNILRKGAISAYKDEKVLIPINMRDGSIIAVGKGNPAWNYSAPHGAGRVLSRSKAKEAVSLKEFEDSMQGIYTTSVRESTIDESPMAYKPIEDILNNIGDTVDVLKIIKPVYNFKAH